jgi:hypothetical protein
VPLAAEKSQFEIFGCVTRKRFSLTSAGNYFADQVNPSFTVREAFQFTFEYESLPETCARFPTQRLRVYSDVQFSNVDVEIVHC